MGGCSARQARWHELFSQIDHHVVYTLGFVNPVGDFLSRWAYGANPAFWGVSIYVTAQVARDVPDMIAAENEELLPRPLVFQAVVAPWSSAPVGGGGAKRTKKLRKLERIAKIKKLWKSHKRATPVHGEDAPNVFQTNWAKQYTNFERYKEMWQDAWNGNFQY